MAELIPADKLISEAKKRKIDLGKGDPYNRLRYYTKIDWLPHMERQKDSGGNVVGHYPEWVLERLELIDELKSKGLTNEEITDKIKSEDSKRHISKAFKFLSTSESRTQTLAYATFILIILILAMETGAFGAGETTKRDLLNSTTIVSADFDQILDSGTSTVPRGEKMIFVKSSKVSPRSKIHITFEDNFGPASKYWVENKVSFEGFYVELDSTVAQDSVFNWWVTN